MNLIFLLKSTGFTFFQAILSTLLSVLGGFLLGRILFIHKNIFTERVLSIILLTPPLTIAIYWGNIAGNTKSYLFSNVVGILICHVFLNLPLAALMVLKGYQTLQSSIWILAINTRLKNWRLLKKIELPLLKNVLIKCFGFIFLMCFNSFTVPLLLGGGPEQSTLSTLLYYTLIVQGNINHALIILGIKISICLIIMISLGLVNNKHASSPARLSKTVLQSLKYPLSIEILVIVCITLILVPPFVFLLSQIILDWAGIRWSYELFIAAKNSLILAVLSSVCVLVSSFTILLAAPCWRQKLEQISYIMLMMPSFVIGVMLFIITSRFFGIILTTFNALLILNFICGLPLALKILGPALDHIESSYSKLHKTLRLSIIARMKWLYIPLLNPALRLAGVIVAAYSLGDLGGILLFNQTEFITLPALIYDTYGHFDIVNARFMSFILMSLAALPGFFLTKEKVTNVKA